MKKFQQGGKTVKGVLQGDGNVYNHRVPVKLNTGEIIYVDAIDDKYLTPDSVYTPSDSVKVTQGLENKATTFKSNNQQALKKVINKKQSGGFIDEAKKKLKAGNWLENIDEVLSAPARSATYLATGKYQDPSDALGISEKEHPYLKLATDIVLDPTNLIGIGAVSKVGKLLKGAKTFQKTKTVMNKPVIETLEAMLKSPEGLKASWNIGPAGGRKMDAVSKVFWDKFDKLLPHRSIKKITTEALELGAKDGIGAVSLINDVIKQNPTSVKDLPKGAVLRHTMPDGTQNWAVSKDAKYADIQIKPEIKVNKPIKKKIILPIVQRTNIDVQPISNQNSNLNLPNIQVPNTQFTPNQIGLQSLPTQGRETNEQYQLRLAGLRKENPDMYKTNNNQNKYQFGGKQPVLIEDGEVYKDSNGNILESNSYSHDDDTMIDEYGNKIKVKEGEGGQIVDAQSVASASYDQVKKGDRKSNAKEEVLKFSPKESNSIINGKWFTTKKTMSPSELIKEAVTQNNKERKRFDKDYTTSVYSRNSQTLNAEQVKQLPTEEDIYDQVFEAQEFKKQISGLNFERNKQYGGTPVSSNGLYDYPNQDVIVPTDGSITMSNVDYPVEAYDYNTGEYLETMQPDQQYNFDTNMVYEKPLKAQSGVNNQSYDVALSSLQQMLKDAKTADERALIQSRIQFLNKQMPPLNTEATIPEPYTIKQGDSLSKIADSYGLTVEDLLKSNPDIQNKNRINTGDKLNIPELTIKGKKPQAQTWSGLSDFDKSIRGDNEFGNMKPEEKFTTAGAQDVTDTPVRDDSTKVSDIAGKAKKIAEAVKIGKLDQSQGTFALRAMMQANRILNLPYRQEIPNRTLGYNEEDVTPYIDEIDSAVNQQLQYVNQNTAQGQAILSSINANALRNKRQIINRVNATNLQRRAQTDNANVQLMNQQDLLQEQSNSNYVNGVQEAVNNMDQRKVQQAEYLDNMVNTRTRQNNAFQLMNVRNPNYKIGTDGSITRLPTQFTDFSSPDQFDGVSNATIQDYLDDELEPLPKKKARFGIRH